MYRTQKQQQHRDRDTQTQRMNPKTSRERTSLCTTNPSIHLAALRGRTTATSPTRRRKTLRRLRTNAQRTRRAWRWALHYNTRHCSCSCRHLLGGYLRIQLPLLAPLLPRLTTERRACARKLIIRLRRTLPEDRGYDELGERECGREHGVRGQVGALDASGRREARGRTAVGDVYGCGRGCGATCAFRWGFGVCTRFGAAGTLGCNRRRRGHCSSTRRTSNGCGSGAYDGGRKGLGWERAAIVRTEVEARDTLDIVYPGEHERLLLRNRLAAIRRTHSPRRLMRLLVDQLPREVARTKLASVLVVRDDGCVDAFGREHMCQRELLDLNAHVTADECVDDGASLGCVPVSLSGSDCLEHARTGQITKSGSSRSRCRRRRRRCAATLCR
ncbi:hypothetical protein EXIGLDRAFT_243101 [Exidia glandulosa HHB12029]|uniref:Uncharacterized protein n=1 Tax=Exidia glandulosa HHB12029 TaxID=1314781 RepID=A0A165Q873_EXIGL|nr:hypothetical protein EXIGLDRAFT_243101 [Exidia glandulosa HHB12029]